MIPRFLILLSLVFICHTWALATRSLAVEWINPLGGNFSDANNWTFSMVPDEFEEANYLLPTDYTVTFPLSAFSSTVNVRNGNVLFEIPSMGVYEVDLVLVGVGGIPMLNPPPASLTVNGGRVQVETAIEIYKGARLGGNGELFSFGPTIHPGGRLTGTLTVIGSTTFNQGVVAPGDLVGTLTLNSDYFQAPEGLLEIEVGGTIPETQHDQLQVSGTAQLAGQLKVPYINGFTPTVGNSITFLQANTVLGAFNSLVLPNATSGVAAQIIYTPNSVALNFVAPLTVGFNSGNLLPPPGFNDWYDTNLWGGGTVPDSTSVVNLVNPQNFDGRIRISPPTGAPEAFTHRTSLSGTTNSMTLAVADGADFTAVERLNVNNRGVVELSGGGTVHSALVKVNPGGLIVGNGTIDGNVLLGTTTGSIQAVLSPGFSAGEITIEENLTIAQNGVVEIEIFAENDFDQVIVGEDANLGGTLVVDITGVTPASIVGDEFIVLTAGDVNQQFADIDTVGAPDFFFQPEYSENEVALLIYGDGDMNCDGDYTSIDVEKFAMALTTPNAYFAEFEIFGEDSGDMNDDGFFDFDDIDQFSQIDFGDLTADEVVAYLLNATSVPEPASALLVMVCVLLSAGQRGRSSY